jgi:hypothetical protein
MSTETTVTYKASHQRADGGWRHIEIALPVGAGDAEIEQAIALWHRLDEKAQEPPTPGVATVLAMAGDGSETFPCLCGGGAETVCTYCGGLVGVSL